MVPGKKAKKNPKPEAKKSSCSTATRDPQCSLSDLNHDHPRPVFPAGPQPRPSTPSVPCRTSTTTIHAQCSLPDLNWAWMVVVEVRQGTLGVDGRGWGPAGNTGRGWSWLRSGREHWAWMVVVEVRQGTLGVDGRGWGPAGNTGRGWSWLRSGREHVGRYGTKNAQKKVRKNVRQVCDILLANLQVCGSVIGAMPLLTLRVAKFEAISLNRWQNHWGGQRHFHFCTFGAVCKDAWDRQHLTASYYKLLEGISCWIDAWDSQHHTEFLLCITAMVAWWICDIGTFVGAFEPSSTRSRARGRMDIIIEAFSRRRLCDQ